MRVDPLLCGLWLVVGCGAAQSEEQFRALREELSIVREKLDTSQKQLVANREQVAQLEAQVRQLSLQINNKELCKLQLPAGLRPGPGAPTRPLKSPLRARLLDPYSSPPAKLDPRSFITHSGPRSFRIKRAGLDQLLSNSRRLARTVRIVPSIRNGVPDGFKLYAIRPRSLFFHLGFRNGDTVRMINGQLMTSPDKVLELYVKLRKATRITIQLHRRGRPVTHVYTIVESHLAPARR